MQAAIANGESFFPSRTRIIVDVAAEVGKTACCSRAILQYQVGISEVSLRRWRKTFEEQGVTITSRRGQHAKSVSPIVDPDFRARFVSQVRSESCRKGIFSKLKIQNFDFLCLGQPHLTTSALASWVNTELALDRDEKYSEECIRLWLHKCGFKV